MQRNWCRICCILWPSWEPGNGKISKRLPVSPLLCPQWAYLDLQLFGSYMKTHWVILGHSISVSPLSLLISNPNPPLTYSVWSWFWPQSYPGTHCPLFQMGLWKSLASSHCARSPTLSYHNSFHAINLGYVLTRCKFHKYRAWMDWAKINFLKFTFPNLF